MEKIKQPKSLLSRKEEVYILKLAVVTLHTFYLGKPDLLTVYLGKLDFLRVTDFSLVTYLGKLLSSGSWICLENNRVSLDSYPKAIKRGCNWLGAIKGIALLSRGFSRGSPFKT